MNLQATTVTELEREFHRLAFETQQVCAVECSVCNHRLCILICLW